MGRPHFVVIRRENSEDEKHRMKPWFREHAEHLPEGMHPDTHTSEQLRNKLGQHGWEIKPGNSEVLVIFPFEDEEEDAVTPSAFALEHHLRDFIAKDIEKCFKGRGRKLKLYKDSEERKGVEYPTDTGRIDILAVSENDQEFFVIELKVSRGSDQAIGQLMRYMSWVNEKLAVNKKVNGIIVAQSIDDRLIRSASMIPQVELFEYKLKFELTSVPSAN